MDEAIEFPTPPDLSAIDFTDVTDIRNLIRQRLHHMFGPQGDDYIDEYTKTTEDLFSGRVPAFQAMDTPYHDIRHTLQATLCLVELLSNRHISNIKPRLSAHDFKRALVAVLFHDIGYLKTLDDTLGTGAKYTHLHEKRSCDFAAPLLAERGWAIDDIRFVENLISCTGPGADFSQIDFASEIERVLGQVVCTADYIGQMSDPYYPDRLEVLFNEFEECYRYQQIPQSEWPFANYENLLRSTPDFWSFFVKPRLEKDCAGVYEYLEHPMTGENPYMHAVKRNLATIRGQIAKLQK